MPSLKNPNKQIPNGFFFRQPEINWDSRRVLPLHPSLDVLTRAVISARKANPHYVQKHKWSLDYNTVYAEVEQFQVKVCLAAGWTSYITQGGGNVEVPLSSSPNPQEQKLLAAAAAKARKLWGGVKTSAEWLDSNEPAVPQELSNARAATCVKCPFNNKRELTGFFTVPAAAAIRRQIERVIDRKLRTDYDDQLGICAQDPGEGNGGCLCPLRSNVHIPLAIKLKYLTPEVRSGLHPGCWVLSEQAAL